jgi:hypothetical protein
MSASAMLACSERVEAPAQLAEDGHPFGRRPMEMVQVLVRKITRTIDTTACDAGTWARVSW